MIILLTNAIGLWQWKTLVEKLNPVAFKKTIFKALRRSYSQRDWFLLSMFGICILLLILRFTFKIPYSFENIYPEIFGLLFDVVLFGVIISIYQMSNEKKKAIKIEKDIIDDFRGWKSNEASHRILGSIKRLQRLGIFSHNLKSCYFEGVEFHKLCFSNSKMTNVSIIDTDINNTDFLDIKSRSLKIRNKSIFGSHFIRGKLEFSLQTDHISSTLFKDIDLTNSRLNITSMTRVLFQEVKFIHSNFKFQNCNCIEFVDCIFDECIVNKDFFEIISNDDSRVVGFDQIMKEYKLVNEERRGIEIWILRNKKRGKIPKPSVTITKEETYSAFGPWNRANRREPNFYE